MIKHVLVTDCELFIGQRSCTKRWQCQTTACRDPLPHSGKYISIVNVIKQ